MLDPDTGERTSIWSRKEFRERVVVRQLTLGNELRNRHCRHHLVHRSHMETGIESVCDAGFLVEQHDSGKGVRSLEPLEKDVELACNLHIAASSRAREFELKRRIRRDEL